jgi:hypothetical protein
VTFTACLHQDELLIWTVTDSEVALIWKQSELSSIKFESCDRLQAACVLQK